MGGRRRGPPQSGKESILFNPDSAECMSTQSAGNIVTLGTHRMRGGTEGTLASHCLESLMCCYPENG